MNNPFKDKLKIGYTKAELAVINGLAIAGITLICIGASMYNGNLSWLLSWGFAAVLCYMLSGWLEGIAMRRRIKKDNELLKESGMMPV